MLDEEQEEELAEWWRENLGLYNKSNYTYRRKAKKDQLIAEKAARMGVLGFDATMLAGWMKSMRTMYGKEEKKVKGKSGDAPPILTPEATLGSGELQLPSTSPQGWEAEKSPWPGKFHYLILFIYILLYS